MDSCSLSCSGGALGLSKVPLFSVLPSMGTQQQYYLEWENKPSPEPWPGLRTPRIQNPEEHVFGLCESHNLGCFITAVGTDEDSGQHIATHSEVLLLRTCCPGARNLILLRVAEVGGQRFWVKEEAMGEGREDAQKEPRVAQARGAGITSGQSVRREPRMSGWNWQVVRNRTTRLSGLLFSL